MNLITNLPGVFVAVSGVLAALVTVLATPWAIAVANRMGAVDWPGGRKDQRNPVPRLGGLAIGLGIGVSVVLSLLVLYDLTTPEVIQLFAIALGTLMIFLLGVADDVFGASVPVKLGVQVLAAGGLIFAGVRFEVLGLPFLGEIQLGPVSALVSLLWIVGVTNAINFIDGLDGLAAGVVAIVAASFSVFALFTDQTLSIVLTTALAGACIGFLRYNWSPARVFMGDCGSLTIGFLLAAVSVHSSLKASATVAILVPVLALGVPVLDTMLVMTRRFRHHPASNPLRRLLRVFHADREHLHHLMLFFNATPARTVFSIYALVLACCVFSLTVAIAKSALLGFGLVAVELLVMIAIRRWGIARRWRRGRLTPPHPDQMSLFG